jgi:hypothetical protein
MRSIFLSAAAPRLVVDPADSSLTAVPGAVTFDDPTRIPDAETARFVPRDPADRDAYDELYRRVFHGGRRWVWLDEPEQAAPANGFPRHVNTVVVQGAKRMIGHGMCATAPKHVMKSGIRNAMHLVVFDLPELSDRKYVAGMSGLSFDEFEAAMAEAMALEIDTPDGPKRGFLWLNRMTSTLTICPPLALSSAPRPRRSRPNRSTAKRAASS